MLADLKRELRRTRRAVRRLQTQAASRPRDRRPYSLDWLRRYLPHHLTVPHFSPLHADLVADLSAAQTTRGSKLNCRAPRGSAKTTVGTVGYALHGAVESVEPFTLLLSESGDVAAEFLRTIKAELEANEQLAADYPAAVGEGPVWRDNHVVLRNGCCLMAKGVGGRIRGLKHLHHRPTLVVIDDGNEKTDAFSPTSRRRKLDWLNKDVMSVGSPQTNYVCYGTPIHREAIVCELSRNGAWKSRAYRSIARWPDRLDLWAEWEKAVTNLADSDRLTTARTFYDAHRADMDAGAEVLWPDRESLYDLMLHRATVGPAAFASEKQDEPGTDGATEWPAEYFDRPSLWFEDWPEGMALNLQALDPSKGLASKAGDYQAHGRLGLAADGTLYVEADLRREPITDCVDRAIELFRTWGSHELIAESNNTMGLLAPEFERNLTDRRRSGREVLCNYAEVYHTEPKLARIRCVGGYLARGQIRVRNTPGGRLLVEQWRDVPAGEYDDGPDAVATLIRRAEQLVNGGAA